MADFFIKRAEELGLEIKTFSGTTRTSQEAANQIGCEPGQIGKSIVFNFKLQILNDKWEVKPVLVIVSGKNRVCEEKLKELLLKYHSNVLENLRIEKADADFVYETTGYPIGGVPPFGHKNPIEDIFMDQDLLQYETIWCAAGTPFSVFEISPQKLIEITHAKIADLKESKN